jgi:hypothetical protein
MNLRLLITLALTDPKLSMARLLSLAQNEVIAKLLEAKERFFWMLVVDRCDECKRVPAFQ